MSEFNVSHNLYGFSLSSATSRILWKLKPLDMCFQVWSNNLDQYIQILIHDQPEYILGMGTYSGIDQDKIKIETIAKNQFRNETIEKDLQITTAIRLHPFIKESLQSEYTNEIENWLGNLVSWKIMRLIQKGTLNAKYTLLYIPVSLEGYITQNIIEMMIRSSLKQNHSSYGT